MIVENAGLASVYCEPHKPHQEHLLNRSSSSTDDGSGKKYYVTGMQTLLQSTISVLLSFV